MKDRYVIVKYLRLSSDDGTGQESNSISHQRDLLDYYIKDNFKDSNVDTIELIDDGYSGTNFNRPSVKKLLILAETRGIDCIIVKDFSRFGRDYIEVGLYLEEKFPEWQIRFISVNDGYDSNNYCGVTSGIETALKNVAYTLYSRDLSEKIRSANRTRQKRGEFTGSYAFYGYIKNPNQRNHIIIDEEAADVIRRIFKMRFEGITARKIAIGLNKDGVLSPAMYKSAKDPLCRKWNAVSDYNYWSASIVGNILRNERYTGKMISGKMKCIAVGSNKYKPVKKDEWIVVENTHEAIISQEMFDAIKEINLNSRKPRISNVSLQSILRCGGCNHILSKFGRINQTVKYFCSYKAYTEDNDCMCENICESDIEEILLEAIKLQVNKALDVEKLIFKIKQQQSNFENVSSVENMSAKIKLIKQERLELYRVFTKGRLNESQFVHKRDDMNAEILLLEEKIKKQNEVSICDEDEKFVQCLKRYYGLKALDQNLVEELIKSIYIYNDKRIEIVWNFCDDITTCTAH